MTPTPAEALALRTTLVAGATVNVSWGMAYPHRGGLRLELLNSRDEPFAVLTPEAAVYVGQDTPEQVNPRRKNRSSFLKSQH